MFLSFKNYDSRMMMVRSELHSGGRGEGILQACYVLL